MTRTEAGALALALLACLMWSGNFFTARGVHEWISPFTLGFWRWCVAIAVIMPFGLPHLLRQKDLVKKHWKFLLIMGATSVGSYNTLIYLSAHYTTTHHIALISSTAPIWTLLLAGILGTERLSRYKICGASFAFVGALVIITHGQVGHILSIDWNKGDLILLLASWIWALYCVLLHFKPKDMHPLTFLSCIFPIGLACIAPFYGWELSQGKQTPFTLEAWGVYAYVGICASVIAWFAWNNAVAMIGSVKAGLVYYTMPLFSGVLAYFFLGEPLAMYHVFGFALIFTGIIISNLRKLGIVDE